jgi:acetyl esterase/lipase
MAQTPLSLIEERRQWEAQAAATPVAHDVVTTEDELNGVRGLWVSAADAVPEKLIIYLHGGGLVAGSPETHLALAASISSVVKHPVLLVRYRLLPEHPFPAPLDDALTVWHGLLKDRGYTAQQLVLSGDSSGAGLALAMMVELRDCGEAQPAAAVMLSGAFDATLSGGSIERNNGRDPMLSARELIDWRDTYLSRPESPLLSPLFAALDKLPPSLLLAGGRDLWLSDSTRLADKLRKSGGDVQLKVWESMGHVWFMDDTLAQSEQALNDIAFFIRSL